MITSDENGRPVEAPRSEYIVYDNITNNVIAIYKINQLEEAIEKAKEYQFGIVEEWTYYDEDKWNEYGDLDAVDVKIVYDNSPQNVDYTADYLFPGLVETSNIENKGDNNDDGNA